MKRECFHEATSAHQAFRAMRDRFRPGPPEPGHGRFSALRALDRLADFHRERAVEPVRETAFRLDRTDGPTPETVRWPFDYVDVAPGAATCDLGTDCLCGPRQMQDCEFRTVVPCPHGEAPSNGRTTKPRGVMARLSNHLAGYDTPSWILLGSIVLLAVFAFMAGFRLGRDLMGKPIMMVINAGMGKTPVPHDALLQPGDILNVHDSNDGSQRPAKVVAVVPVGVSPEIAIADQSGFPRPLMLTDPRHREPLYILEWEGRQFQVKHEKIRKGLDRARDAGLADGASDGR